MSTKQELEAIVTKARNEIWEMERKERYAETAAHVGRCFRYRNSYSGSDGWWLYSRVVGIDKDDGEPQTFTFQQCSDGRIEINTDKRAHLGLLGDEITLRLFRAEYRKLQSAIAKKAKKAGLSPSGSGDA